MEYKNYSTRILFFLLMCMFVQKAVAQNVGIQQANPASRLDVNGNLTIGSGYTGTAAPLDGAIIEGDVGIGTNAPVAKLDVDGTWKLGARGSVNEGLFTIRWDWGVKTLVMQGCY